MVRIASLLACLFVATPSLAEDCAWISKFVRGEHAPDVAACDGPVCQWRFEYRNGAAQGLFDLYAKTLETCLGPQPEADLGVNHPDSYDLKQFHTEEGTVFISKKDKAALQQTLVFLRVERATNP